MTAAEFSRSSGIAAAVLLLAGCGTISPLSSPDAPTGDAPAREAAASLAHYGRAVLADLESDPSTARAHYEAAAKGAADPVDFEQRVIFSLLQEDRNAEALERAMALVEAYPDDARSRLLLGLIYRAEGRTDEALAAYRELRRRHPDLAMGYMEESTLRLRNDQPEEARALLVDGLKKTRGEERLRLVFALGELALRDGYRHMQEGPVDSVAEAIPYVDEAYRTHPEADTLPYLLSDLYLLNRETAEALRILLDLHDQDPDNLQIRRKILSGLAGLDDPEAALALLREHAAGSDTPEHAEFLIGELHEQTGDIDAALEHYRGLAATHPDKPGPYLKQVVLLIAEERNDEAAAVIDEALARIPGEPRFHELRAYLAMADDRDADALEDFQQAAAMYTADERLPALPNFWLNFGLAHQHRGQLDEAAEKIARAMDEDDDALDRYFAHLWKKRDPGLIASGLDVLARLGDRLPDTLAIQIQLALFNKQVERYAESVARFDRALELAEAAGKTGELDETFYFWYGAANERIRNYDRAEELFLKAVTLKPDFADAHNYLAYMNAERGVNLDLAFDHIDLALAVEPDNPAFIDTLGWVHYRKGDYEAAVRELERAVALLDDDPTLLDHLGDAYDKIGRRDDALAAWRKALEHDPENPEAIQAKIAAAEEGPEPEPVTEPAVDAPAMPDS